MATPLLPWCKQCGAETRYCRCLNVGDLVTWDVPAVGEKECNACGLVDGCDCPEGLSDMAQPYRGPLPEDEVAAVLAQERLRMAMHIVRWQAEQALEPERMQIAMEITKLEKEKKERGECVVCMEHVPEMAFPCGHYCVCQACSKQLPQCPVCRKVGSPFRIYPS